MADLEKLIPAVIERGKTDAVALQAVLFLGEFCDGHGITPIFRGFENEFNYFRWKS